MHISQVHLKNYKNYHDCKVELSEGLNVIVGPNNTGKSNLLDAIEFIFHKPDKNIDDFNKYDLYKNLEYYKLNVPSISIEYVIEHNFSYDVEDSALSKLKPIIIYDKNAQLKEDIDGIVHIVAKVKLMFEINKTFEQDFLNEVKNIVKYEEYLAVLKRFEKYFGWTYYNTLNNEELSDKDINEIFEVDKIPAYRDIDQLEAKSRLYVSNKIDKVDEVKIQQEITKYLRDELTIVNAEINEEIKADQDNIGITDGRNNFISEFEFDKDLSEFFRYSLRNDTNMFTLPLKSNGLGYNNLIFIRNLIKQKKDNDYNILMLEEPEAHLHPNMQYKLLKYLNSLESIKQKDEGKSIKNQIIITTHSSNISASVDMNKIIILNYDREIDLPNVCSSKLSDNFDIKKVKELFDISEISRIENKTEKQINKDLKNLLVKSKEHLQKFLDITRSDILYSDKIILVEGIAEKLTLPWVDEELTHKHICVVEVAGINFDRFLPLIFFTNKKILCITDKDCDIFDERTKGLIDKKTYKRQTNHVSYLFKHFKDNIKIVEQEKYGSTFEKELFIENYKTQKNFKLLMQLALPDCCKDLSGVRNISIWHDEMSSKITNEKTRDVVRDKIDKYWDAFNAARGRDKKLIEMMFFTNLFYKYVENNKGSFCLEILEHLKNSRLKIPKYLLRELEWIKR